LSPKASTDKPFAPGGLRYYPLLSAADYGSTILRYALTGLCGKPAGYFSEITVDNLLNLLPLWLNWRGMQVICPRAAGMLLKSLWIVWTVWLFAFMHARPLAILHMQTQSRQKRLFPCLSGAYAVWQ
jgi:hypothetical protein